ncbi:unnamed protein product [Microthlaspi erraticum]|uniref:Uncharacterized protein n=1 Tax=Microthlaspi erraticum TaxID=1685480 RepID=A0A6D2KMV9_9BRAS|nr:unnamed protein product [Microthlaspi erraticum]
MARNHDPSDNQYRSMVRSMAPLAKRVEIMVTEFQTDRSRFAWSDICCTETPQICLLPPSRFLPVSSPSRWLCMARFWQGFAIDMLSVFI